MSDTLDGRVAIVTGAGRGIGRATAKLLASMGAKVVVNDLGVAEQGTGADPSPADETVAEIRELGGEAVANHDSVADHEAAARIIATALDHFGRLDILVNNAGITGGGSIDRLSPGRFERVLGVHLHGTYNCTRHAVPHLIEQRYGRIVNIVSRAGLLGAVGVAAYAAAKGGIFGFTNAVCRDLHPHGITVNNVSPFATATRMVLGPLEQARARGWDTATFERMASQAQQPEKVAPVIAFLAMEEAGHITGQTFLAHGDTVGRFAPISVAETLVAEHEWTPEALAEAAKQLDIPSVEDLF